jgi:hypothetical protein
LLLQVRFYRDSSSFSSSTSDDDDGDDDDKMVADAVIVSAGELFIAV